MGFFAKAGGVLRYLGQKAIGAGRWIGTMGADFVQKIAPALPGPFGAAAMGAAAAMRGVGAIAEGIHGLGRHASGVAGAFRGSAQLVGQGIRDAYAQGGGQVASRIERK